MNNPYYKKDPLEMFQMNGVPTPQPISKEPNMFKQIGKNIAVDTGNDIAKDVTQPYVDQAKTNVQDFLGMGTNSTDAAATGASKALASKAVEGGLGAAGTGMASAMPLIGVGLLAGKAFGLFNKGGMVGPLSYAAYGGKMKYRNEGSYMPEQPTGEELKALEEQMKKRMMIEQMYENNRRAQEEAGEMMPEMEGYGPLRYYRFEKGGKADAVEADIQNEDTISKMGIDQFGEQANMIRKQNLWTNEEMYGPLKAVKYKAAGGDAYEKQYHNPLMNK